MGVQAKITMFNVVNLETIPGDLYEIKPMYNPDSRVSKYIDAKVHFKVPENMIYCGHGEIYRPNHCGKLNGFARCDTCGEVRPLIDHCGKLTCPVCLRMAASKKGYHVAKEKVLPFINTISENYNLNTLAGHYCLSPTDTVPVDNLTKFGVKWYEKAVKINNILYSKKMYDSPEKRKQVIEFVRQIISPYLYASIIVFHPGRFENESIKENLVWSPHFHIIGWRHKGSQPNHHLPPNTYQKVGCIFTCISKLPRIRDITQCMSYLLTHTWINSYRKMKKRRYWKNPDTLTKVRYNEALNKEYEQYVDDIIASNNRAEYYLEPERFKVKMKSFDEWLHYPSNHSSPAYFYQGLIRPHHIKNLQEKNAFETIDCDNPKCEGLMCDADESCSVLDTKSQRNYSIPQIREFGISIFLYDNTRYSITVWNDKPLGTYMFRKYLKKRIFVNANPQVEAIVYKKYDRKKSRRLDLLC